MDESCYTHGWVVSHTLEGHGTHMNGSRHTHEGSISQIWQPKLVVGAYLT